MSSQSFLWLNVGFAITIAAIFLIGRSRMRAPTRLKLNLTQQRNSLLHKSYRMSDEIKLASGDALGTKNLNVIFIYNGHSWDAHEILGVPAGAKIEDVHKAYKIAAANCDQQSQEFIETAYYAIIKGQK